MKKLVLLVMLSSVGLALTAMQSSMLEGEISPRDLLNLSFEELLEYSKSLPEAPKLHQIVQEMHEVKVKCDEYDALALELDFLSKKGLSGLGVRDSNGNTVFHVLARLDNVSIFSKLVERVYGKGKFDQLNAQNNHGQTPLHWAAMFGHTEMVKALLVKKAEPSKSDKEGRTPLHLAAAENRLEVVGLLLDEVKNSNVQDNYGETPVSLASQNGAFDVVELLELCGDI